MAVCPQRRFVDMPRLRPQIWKIRLSRAALLMEEIAISETLSGVRKGPNSGQAYLAGLYLQREILGVDAALGQTASDKPEARLRRARKHVAQLQFIAKSPDGADAGGNTVAKQLANQILLPFVAGRQHDQVGGEHIAGAHPRSLCDELDDIGKLHQSYLTFNDQIGTADIEIVAAATCEVLELPARSVFPEIKLEPHALKSIEEFPVKILRSFGQEDVGFP